MWLQNGAHQLFGNWFFFFLSSRATVFACPSPQIKTEWNNIFLKSVCATRGRGIAPRVVARLRAYERARRLSGTEAKKTHTHTYTEPTFPPYFPAAAAAAVKCDLYKWLNLRSATTDRRVSDDGVYTREIGGVFCFSFIGRQSYGPSFASAVPTTRIIMNPRDAPRSSRVHTRLTRAESKRKEKRALLSLLFFPSFFFLLFTFYCQNNSVFRFSSFFFLFFFFYSPPVFSPPSTGVCVCVLLRSALNRVRRLMNFRRLAPDVPSRFLLRSPFVTK